MSKVDVAERHRDGGIDSRALTGQIMAQSGAGGVISGECSVHDVVVLVLPFTFRLKITVQCAWAR